ncbi:MAG: asparagine synthase (glutamine-hydrolyzing) [Armatimonadetes bacterium]|nr:asparagine synthase (glutamine-hydrolyzing) [Armatimonadota bacterium]
MCGIVGFLCINSRVDDFDTHLIERLSELMSRRGPDDKGFWSDGKWCALGFRRLAILDLSPNGRQPMVTGDGRYVLVYNGEVYNFRELRRELESKGVRFRSTGDAEVVLYSLVHWGIKALERFNGMFALGFYDSVEKRLLLARDHAGIKPLYYLLVPQGLVFASQYDQILAHPWSQDLQISTQALSLYLRLGYIPAPYALLANTYMLEPGTWLEVKSDGTIKRGRFFEFPVYREPELFGEDAYEAVDSAVTEAVKRHLVSDVPVGTFLSGGVDSPLVAAKIREVCQDEVKAFTIGTNGDCLDESQDAIKYAQEIGLEHIVEHVQPDDALEMLDEVVKACGEPFADYSIFPTMIVSRLARQHGLKVMLSGDGGDELFWGYVGRFSSVIEKAQDFRQPYWWRSVRWGLKKFFKLGKGHPNLRYPSIGEWYRAKHSRISEGWLRRIFHDAPEWPEDCELFNYDGWEVDRTAQWLRWNEFVGHLTMVLLKVDRASMYCSLEVRVPLLDREVVELATKLDWRSCLDIKRKVGKIPLRYALARHVRYQSQSKRGFTVPMNEWLRGPLRPVFEDAVLGQKEILGLTLNRKNLLEMFHQHLSGQSDYAWGLWLLLSLTLWEEHHFRNHKSKSKV